MDLEIARLSEQEAARTTDVLRIIPKGRRSALEIGPLHGRFSRLLTDYFETVTTLDLMPPDSAIDRVTPVIGDATDMPFPDNSFDCVICTEVLEHIPDARRACTEIARVARYEVVIGVPYKQDIRVARATCARCGHISPAWGHVNTFDELRLQELFPQLILLTTSFVSHTREKTNALSAWLMDMGGNPWGTYEPLSCIHCGALLTAPSSRTLLQRTLAALALRLTYLQRHFVRPRPSWIHMAFSKLQNSIEAL